MLCFIGQNGISLSHFCTPVMSRLSCTADASDWSNSDTIKSAQSEYWSLTSLSKQPAQLSIHDAYSKALGFIDGHH